MTSFIQPTFATEHPGVQRAEAIYAAAGRLRHTFDGTKGLAAMLLAAMVAALIVVADQLVSVWADGYLLASWVTLWAIAFTALALMAPAAQRLAAGMSVAWEKRVTRMANERIDAQYWASAKSDPRIMAELQAAIWRAEQPQTGLAAKTMPIAKSVATLSRATARAPAVDLVADGDEPVNQVELSAALARVHNQLPPGKRYLRHV